MGKQNLKLIAAIVLLVAAGVIFVATRGDSEEEKYRKELMKPRDLICTRADCGHSFKLSAEETKAAFDAAPEPAAPSEEGGRTRRDAVRRPPKMIKCPKCGEESVVLAAKCPTHDVLFPSFMPDGTKGKCPKCAGNE